MTRSLPSLVLPIKQPQQRAVKTKTGFQLLGNQLPSKGNVSCLVQTLLPGGWARSARPPSPPGGSHRLPSSLYSSGFLMQTAGSPFWCKPPMLRLLCSSAPSQATLRYPGLSPEGRAPGPGLCLLCVIGSFSILSQRGQGEPPAQPQTRGISASLSLSLLQQSGPVHDATLCCYGAAVTSQVRAE